MTGVSDGVCVNKNICANETISDDTGIAINANNCLYVKSFNVRYFRYRNTAIMASKNNLERTIPII